MSTVMTGAVANEIARRSDMLQKPAAVRAQGLARD